MIKVDISLDNELMEQLMAHLEYFSGKNGKEIAPNTLNAFNTATRMIQTSWQNWAKGGSLQGAMDIKNPSPNLARSIKLHKENDFSAEISTENQQMVSIQEGRAEYDMKNPAYYAGRKSRVSKNGVPYVIIPFRWGTPNKEGGARAHFSNFMTTDIHNYVENKKTFERSIKTGGTHFEKNAKGEDVERNEYDWGDRLPEEGNMNGLVAFPDGKRNSTYFTFRIISAKTDSGWVRKAVPANDVIGALKKNLEPKINDLIDEGLRSDVE
jgi:hypothetical protein